MGLAEVRERINDIDASLMALLDKRAECSVGVADAKLGSGDLIYKPEREREICDKFEDAGKGMGANVIKSVMRNSRLIQYEMYADNGIVPEKFKKIMQNLNIHINRSADNHASDNVVKLEIGFDDSNEKKLGKSDILLVLAESGFEIKELEMSADTIDVTVAIGTDEEKCRKAYVLFFMLFMETENFGGEVI
jgi:chorismate mutase